jgi:hypothetical protein
MRDIVASVGRMQSAIWVIVDADRFIRETASTGRFHDTTHTLAKEADCIRPTSFHPTPAPPLPAGACAGS